MLVCDTGARVNEPLNRTEHGCELRLMHHAHGKFAFACVEVLQSVRFTVPEKRSPFCCEAYRIARAEVKALQAIVTEKESQTASAPRLRKWGKTRSASRFHAH